VNGLTHESITFGEFRDSCIRLGSALKRLDVAQKDVVALVSPNCPEFVISFFAIGSIGATTTTINCTYTAEEIAQQLKNSNASVVITHSVLLPTVQEACKLYDGIRHIIVNGPLQEGCLSFQNLLKDDGKAFPHSVQINPREDVLVLPYSSGTTGLPKGVMLTHYNLIANMQQITYEAFNTFRDMSGNDQEVLMGVLPFFHIYGMVCLMGLSLYEGAKMVTLPTFDPNLFSNTLEKYQVSYLHTVPPIINFLNHSPLITPRHFEPTHTIVCGAAPLGPALVEEFWKKFGEDIQFQEGFGMTEASPVTHLTPAGKYTPGSTGVAVPNTMAKIADINTGQTLGPGIEGELCVHGPQVMKGYYNNEKATKETIDENGWLHTGDIAKIDDQQNVFIVDRLKELIKVKGFQVAPAELEDLLRKHPNVTDVAVIGVPDERAGEVPRAYVVLEQGSHTTEPDIADFIAKEVAPHKKLMGGVEFVKSIPKSATGKILRRNLKESLQATG
ncbi:hypothetical protein SK128_028319, partial [Halocaridina rubra]